MTLLRVQNLRAYYRTEVYGISRTVRAVDGVSFDLYPNAFLMKAEEGKTALSANPDSRHYWHKDVFTFITSMPDPESIKDTATFRDHPVQQGDTVYYSNGYIIVDQIIEANKTTNKDLPLVDSAWLADVTVYSNSGTTYKAQPALFSKNNAPIAKRDTVMSQNLVLQVNMIGNAIALGVKESNAVMKYITLKAFQFPFIIILWLGILVMSAGFFISMGHRFKKDR